MKPLLRRYAPFLATTVIFLLFLFLLPAYQAKAVETLRFQAKTLILVIPPIFVLLGLLDVWVPREQMMDGTRVGHERHSPRLSARFLCRRPALRRLSRSRRIDEKGASFSNILVFIGAWSTTKLPMLLFESSALGVRFALARLAIDIVGIIVIAVAIKALLPNDEIERLYIQAERIE